MIRSVELTNFKCFAHRKLPVAPLTLLTGVNGAGKSSVMQALLVLRQSYDQRLLAEHRLALNGELVQLGRASDALHDRADREEIGIGVGLDGAAAFSIRVRYRNDAEVLEAVAPAPLPDEVLKEALFGPQMFYLSAERVGPRTSFALSEPASRAMSVGTRGEFAPQLVAVHGDRRLTVPELLHEGARSTKLRDQLEAWLSHVSPGVRLEAKAFPDIDVVQLGFRFARASEVSEAFRPTNVGFGLTYTLPVLVALLSARPGALALVENPEAHLHPRGQALLGEMLARAAAAGIQVLCETHSDHVLNGVRIAVAKGRLPPSSVAVHFFTRSREGTHEVLSPAVQQNGRLTQWPEDFFDQWDRSLEELLQLEGG
jgi:predicted ATPase